MFEFLKKLFSREGQAKPTAPRATGAGKSGAGAGFDNDEEGVAAPRGPLPPSIRAEGPLEADDRDFVMKTLRTMTWAGFDTRADILAAALGGLSEEAGDTYESRLWIEAQLDQMVAEKTAAQAGWPPTVEFDRLEAAFEALGDQGVVALGAAGYSREETRAEAWTAFADAPGPASKKLGIAFYALADVESALEGGPFRVSFEPATRGDEADLARRVGGALAAAGFGGVVETTARIRLADFVWRKRSPF